jgi:ABC-2 type transport system ATP-binding protein
MFVRLAFAVAVHVDPDVLLVDEVLAVGDEPFQRKCIERIKQFQRDGKTIIFVTHGLDMVRQLCDRVIMLEHGDVLVDGTPVDALRAFRDRYEQEVVALDEYGTRRLEVRKVLVTDGHGTPKDRFDSGETLGVELEVAANAPTDDWEAGVAILNHLDILVYGTNTRLQGIKLPPIDGHRRVRFTFDEIPMIEGQYMVTVALHNRDETEQYHRLERIASFRVFSPPNSGGMVHINTDIQVVGG